MGQICGTSCWGMCFSIMNAHLKQTLNNLYQAYQIEYLSMDPLELVRQYKKAKDQEIAAFIAAGLSLGKYELIRQAIHQILTIMGPSPYLFVKRFNPNKMSDVFSGFIYRFYRGRDICLLLFWLKQILNTYPSLESFFLRDYREDDPDIGTALSRFVQSILSLETHPFYPSLPAKGSGIRHFLADPMDGSTCKRLNLFLRWVVRRDNLDLGIWERVSPSKLIIPVDTHIARISQRLGLAKRRTPDWKMALEITESLRQFDSQDPVKYDFALCTIGKMNPCQDHRSACPDCPIESLCIQQEKST